MFLRLLVSYERSTSSPAVHRRSFHRPATQAQHNDGQQVAILDRIQSLIFTRHWFKAQSIILFSRIAVDGSELPAFFRKKRRSSGMRMEQATKYTRLVHSDIEGYCSFNSRMKGTA